MPSRLTIHALEPAANHTHTAIFLHGRGDNGPDFAEELFASTISDGRGVIASEAPAPAPAPAPTSTLRTRFPSWRWVFPSAPARWSTVFEEEFPAWFEAHSLSDITLREDLQMEGIRESVAEIIGILDDEVRRLGGNAQNVILGGISQGGAAALWALLSLLDPRRAGAEPIPRLGAFVGASCWLPFASAVGTYLPGVGVDGPSNDSRPGSNATDSITDGGSQDFVRSMLEGARISIASHGRDYPLLTTPVFLGHGTDDAYVDVSLGRQTKVVLSGIGFDVTWKEYVGAEQEGHWYKEPQELDDIARFLSTIATA
ncbi:hypothetical protein PV04_02875 [Phialophora macrospora]|uniref:Phospholipase/carboxylesterase/thioesterase domain-containing protein n=1 Tax=Phialophora macrospora TaxID=1851006 RepID=A0A0D2E8K6_9EURO|nr:hypothetical protein PV04_02875 [Phialophora macrospora]